MLDLKLLLLSIGATLNHAFCNLKWPWLVGMFCNLKGTRFGKLILRLTSKGRERRGREGRGRGKKGKEKGKGREGRGRERKAFLLL